VSLARKRPLANITNHNFYIFMENPKMNKEALKSIVEKFGGTYDEEIEGLLKKLNFLEDTCKYGKLMKSILSTNDKSNFLADVFEASFAFQFESSNLPLEYEVKQSEVNNSSIDFLRRMDSGISIYLEARQLQQDSGTGQSIMDQLDRNKFYRISMNGDDEHDSIVRLQNVIVSKVQKKNGTPTKFLSINKDIINIVVIDVSDLILGTIDLYDCLLATHGDSYVEEIYRRGIFGLFQEPLSGYPSKIEEIAESYEYIRGILHGVLFLFKAKNSGLLNYDLEHYMVWNPSLVDQKLAKEVSDEINKAVPIKSN